MAGGRRTPKSGSFKHHAHSIDERHACEIPTPQQAMPPKHVPLPDLPMSSELGFDIDIFIFCLLAMGGQYINLYRSVFWLPYSNTDYALNFYLIDLHVLSFNLIIVGRKLPFSLLKQVCFIIFPASIQPACSLVIKIMVVTALTPCIVYCSYNIFIQHGTLSIFCLGYPLVVYIILFGPTLTQLLEFKNFTIERSPTLKPKGPQVKNSPFSVAHFCSMSPETVREEIDVMKSDFNFRLKQALFNSFLVAYYLSFVPCCFAQNTLYYDTYWAGQHVLLTFVSVLTMMVVYYFPSRYCDILHRASLHLGRWQKVDMKNMHVPYNIWIDTTMWNQGAHVKHSKEFFKAEGIANAAEPGNLSHTRFYTIFINPCSPIGCLFTIQLALVTFLLYLLMSSYDWHHLFSIQFLLLMNFKTLFKITRDILVIKRIYKEERVLLQSFNN